YDVFHRPRRQEFDGYLVENGAFYITGRKELLEKPKQGIWEYTCLRKWTSLHILKSMNRVIGS
ncbi:hypothetical protein LEA_07332, partial [human gut metagenome]